VNYQPESRVRENRMHGSEGGGTGVETGPSYPYQVLKPGSQKEHNYDNRYKKNVQIHRVSY